MKHARDDYNRIQDPAHLIPADEPVFLLRGQDRLAEPIIKAYITLTEALPDHDTEVIYSLGIHLSRIRIWQHTHPAKTADM